MAALELDEGRVRNPSLWPRQVELARSGAGRWTSARAASRIFSDVLPPLGVAPAAQGRNDLSFALVFGERLSSACLLGNLENLDRPMALAPAGAAPGPDVGGERVVMDSCRLVNDELWIRFHDGEARGDTSVMARGLSLDRFDVVESLFPMSCPPGASSRLRIGELRHIVGPRPRAPGTNQRLTDRG